MDRSRKMVAELEHKKMQQFKIQSPSVMDVEGASPIMDKERSLYLDPATVLAPLELQAHITPTGYYYPASLSMVFPPPPPSLAVAPTEHKHMADAATSVSPSRRAAELRRVEQRYAELAKNKYNLYELNQKMKAHHKILFDAHQDAQKETVGAEFALRAHRDR